MRLPILLEGSQVLRTKSLDFMWKDDPLDPELETLLSNMNDTMLAEDGMGLAANQVGYLTRIFILKETNGFSEYINPEILAQEELVTFENEGCLSIPGVTAGTKRYRKIRLKWWDKKGFPQEADFLDMRAFAVQHEMDHLNGKLYVDQFGPTKRMLTLDKSRKFLRRK